MLTEKTLHIYAPHSAIHEISTSPNKVYLKVPTWTFNSWLVWIIVTAQKDCFLKSWNVKYSTDDNANGCHCVEYLRCSEHYAKFFMGVLIFAVTIISRRREKIRDTEAKWAKIQVNLKPNPMFIIVFCLMFYFSSTILKNIQSCLTFYWLPAETRKAVYWISEIFSTNDLDGGRIQCVCVCVWLVKEKNKRELNKNFANLYLSLKL